MSIHLLHIHGHHGRTEHAGHHRIREAVHESKAWAIVGIMGLVTAAILALGLYAPNPPAGEPGIVTWSYVQ